MVKLCHGCGAQRAALRRPKTGDQLCKECFYAALEEEVHRTIVDNRLFKPGEKVGPDCPLPGQPSLPRPTLIELLCR